MNIPVAGDRRIFKRRLFTCPFLLSLFFPHQMDGTTATGVRSTPGGPFADSSNIESLDTR
jgi:hypothetical protein